jgi:hypothetical protein
VWWVTAAARTANECLLLDAVPMTHSAIPTRIWRWRDLACTLSEFHGTRMVDHIHVLIESTRLSARAVPAPLIRVKNEVAV